MRTHATQFLAACCILFSIAAGSDAKTPVGSPVVPLGDPVYDFLDRCAVRSLISINTTNIRPLTRYDVAGLLMSSASKCNSLNDPVLKADLSYFLREFAWDVLRWRSERGNQQRRPGSVSLDINSILSKPHKHLKSVSSGEMNFVFDPVVRFRVDADKDRTVVRRAAGIGFYGNVSQWVGYRFQFVDHTERGGGPYWRRDQLMEDVYGYVGPLQGNKETYYDMTEASMSMQWKRVNLFFGKDRISWGPGSADKLQLSGNGPSFNHLNLNIRLFSNARFSYLVGKLQPHGSETDTLYMTEEGWTRTAISSKWIAAHRLEYSPWDNVTIGIAESIIWGERGLDAAYLNPLNFYYSAEHDGGDRDNVLMSGDIQLRIANRCIVYGELLIDDLKTSTLGKGDPGNKLGFRAGGWLSDTGIDGLETSLEYTRLEPFVYSHFFPVNVFSTWTTSLGSDLRPNSDRIRWIVLYRPVRNIEISGRLDINRHGSTGGSIINPVPFKLTESVTFLTGSREEWTAGELSIQWEPLTGLFLRTGGINDDQSAILPKSSYVSVSYRLSRI